ncbi:MAG: tetratricopeptide repeat protein [Verrucomicrobia bacterium]|nr:tetratricopeptide repeat protein [Verrucomicrobiota bacterium]
MKKKTSMDASEPPDWRDWARRIEDLYEKGHLFHQLGHEEEALASYNQAAALCHAHFSQWEWGGVFLGLALNFKACALVDLNRMEEAIPVFDEAIRSREQHVRGDGFVWDAHDIAVFVRNKGLALMRLDRHSEAHACFETALEAFTSCDQKEEMACTWINFGSLYTRQGRLDAALATFEESLKLREESLAGETDIAKADYAYTQFCKAETLFKLGRSYEALEAITHAIPLQRSIQSQTRDPSDREHLTDTLTLRGEILARLGQVEESEECLCEVARLKKQQVRGD